MDTLPVLVPVVAAVLCIPGVFFCGCYRSLSNRLGALEERVAVVTAAAPQSPPASGYVGGVTYGAPALAAPHPSAPPVAYPVYLSPPLPRVQPPPYWSPQKQTV